MRLFRTDRLYEEAARSSAASDELLKQLQRTRWNSALALLGFGLLLLLFCLVGMYTLQQAIRNPASESGGWLSAPVAWIIAGPLFAGAFVEFVVMVSCDVQVKMLLFLRNQKTDSDAEDCGVTTKV